MQVLMQAGMKDPAAGTAAATCISLDIDVREKDRIGIFGTGLSYGGLYGRVTSESIGRDLNPLGRGGGQALVGRINNYGSITSPTPISASFLGSGNSVNNSLCYIPSLVNFDSSNNNDCSECEECICTSGYTAILEPNTEACRNRCKTRKEWPIWL